MLTTKQQADKARFIALRDDYRTANKINTVLEVSDNLPDALFAGGDYDKILCALKYLVKFERSKIQSHKCLNNMWQNFTDLEALGDLCDMEPGQVQAYILGVDYLTTLYMLGSQVCRGILRQHIDGALVTSDNIYRAVDSFVAAHNTTAPASKQITDSKRIIMRGELSRLLTYLNLFETFIVTPTE